MVVFTKNSMMMQTRNITQETLVWWLAGLIVIISCVQANGTKMTNFETLRNYAENIVRERAYDPQQLAAILATSFELTDDDLPNHFKYTAAVENHEVFSSCNLRAPKTDRAKKAILVCEVKDSDATSKNVHQAYGESVLAIPGSPGAAPESLHYLVIRFDNAELSFGVDQQSNRIKRVVIKFDL